MITFLQTLRHHHGAIVAMSVDPQGKVLYTCGADSYIKYYDIDHGREESILFKRFCENCKVRLRTKRTVVKQ